DVYVRQDCTGDGNGYSPNSAKATFTTLCNATNVPYTQNFESALVPALPACTSQEQLGLGNTWVTVSNPGNGFTSNTLKYTYNTDNPANVWFYTQGVNLTVGTYYTISYRYGNNSTTYAPEKLKVAYGTSPSNGAMNNTLADHPNINQAAAQSNTVSFTPPSTGVYYFGFKAYSDADKFYLYVDDIVVDVAPWTWTGTTNTDWGTASNWDLGSVPTSTSNVIIPNVANKPVVGAGTYAAKNATINTGSSLTINGTLQVNGNITNNATITGAGSLALNGITAQTFNVGTVGATIASFSLNNTAGATLSGTGKLNVTDVLTVQDGSTLTTGGVVVLKSDANNTARLAPVGTGIISGNVTVERYIPAKASRYWSLLSSPVTQSLQNSWQQQIHITGAGTGGTVCPSLTAHTNGFDATATNTPSAYTYDASQAQGSRWQA
ncbi:MAG: hypothetical protein H3C56_10745, partial [Chitinophagaceae bacterium]|nr:hypothetical protein [Chitinophagaceae bacterium]